MEFKELQGIIKGVTMEDVENDILVEVISAYGAISMCVLKLSELENCLLSIDDRTVNRDFYVVKY